MSELLDEVVKQVENQQRIIRLYGAYEVPVDRYELGKIAGMLLILDLIKKYEEPEEV